MSYDDLWIGAYFPDSLLSRPHSRVLMCLLFDKIVCHFPVTDMVCGGNWGISDFYSDSPLVDEGVLELREEILLDKIEVQFSPGYFWGTNEEFNNYLEIYKLQKWL